MSDTSQESWKSAASELHSFDGGKKPLHSFERGKKPLPLSSANNNREYQHIAPKENPLFNKIPSPQNSNHSNEFPRTGSQNPNSQESGHTSYESFHMGSNYSTSHDSGPGSSKISTMLQSMNNLNLQVRTKESSTYSLSQSSDHSEGMNFPSDVSFEILDQHRISGSSRGSTSSQATWKTRFRIAAEIATALNFLHRTRPKPLVHRDLKPANILLDKNYVSKISDVGLARLVPSSIADCVTQYHMTAAAGTFCYIDPEYQQTGMLGTKSDIYSLGIMLLQIITAKPAMGLTHHVENAIETGKFAEILDPMVKDWPVEEALSFAELALKCCELRRKDRPDLDSVILPSSRIMTSQGKKGFK